MSDQPHEPQPQPVEPTEPPATGQPAEPTGQPATETSGVERLEGLLERVLGHLEHAPAPTPPAAVTLAAPPAASSAGAHDTPDSPLPPTVPPIDFRGLELVARRRAADGVWEFGVLMGGAYVALVARKLGGVDDDLREAADPGFRQRRADALERERQSG